MRTRRYYAAALYADGRVEVEVGAYGRSVALDRLARRGGSIVVAYTARYGEAGAPGSRDEAHTAAEARLAALARKVAKPLTGAQRHVLRRCLAGHRLVLAPLGDEQRRAEARLYDPAASSHSTVSHGTFESLLRRGLVTLSVVGTVTRHYEPTALGRLLAGAESRPLTSLQRSR